MKFSPGKIQKSFGFENQQDFAKIIIIICKNHNFGNLKIWKSWDLEMLKYSVALEWFLDALEKSVWPI